MPQTPTDGSDRWKEWADYFSRFSPGLLRSIYYNLRISTKHVSYKGVIVQVSRAYAERTLVLAQIEAAEPVEKQILALVMDSDQHMLPAAVLVGMLSRQGISSPESPMVRLVSSGLLLPWLNRDQAWFGESSLHLGTIGSGIYFVPPWFRSALAGAIPDYRAKVHTVVTEPVQRDTSPRALVGLRQAILYLRTTCSFAERFRRPLNRKGALSAAALSLYKEQDAAYRRLDLLSWLLLGKMLGLLNSEDGQRWFCTPKVSDLQVDPLGVYLKIPGILLNKNISLKELYETYNSYGYSFDIYQIYCHVTLRNALLEPPAADRARAWFSIPELRQYLDHVIRHAAHDLTRSIDERIYKTRFLNLHHKTIAFNVINELQVLGLIEMSSPATPNAFRYTRLGLIALRPGAQELGGLRGAGAWQADGSLRIADETKRELAALALGPLAKDGIGPDGVIKLTPARLVEAMRLGQTAQTIKQRLMLLTAGAPVPESLSVLIGDQATYPRAVLAFEQIAVLEAGPLSPDEREALKARGCWVRGDLVLLAPDMGVGVASMLGARFDRSYSYDKPAVASLHLDRDGTLSMPGTPSRDLRLRSALAAFGIGLPLPEGARLCVEAMPGLKGQGQRSPTKQIQAPFQDLISHIVRMPETDNAVDLAWLRLRAEAGLVEAPQVEEPLLLTFPEQVTHVLMTTHALPKGVELLYQPMRLLVPRALAAGVEEALSALGIPFPADKSVARETMRARSAVQQLQQAMLGAGLSDGPLTDAQGRDPEPVRPTIQDSKVLPPDPPSRAVMVIYDPNVLSTSPDKEIIQFINDSNDLPNRPTRVGEAPTPEPDGPSGQDGGARDETLPEVKDRVVEALRQVSAERSGGLLLDEIARDTGLSKARLKRALAALLRQGRIRSEGRTRGMRYVLREP